MRVIWEKRGAGLVPMQLLCSLWGKFKHTYAWVHSELEVAAVRGTLIVQPRGAFGREDWARFWSLHPGEWDAGFIVPLLFTFPISLCKVEVFIILKKTQLFSISVLLIWLYWVQHIGLVAHGLWDLSSLTRDLTHIPGIERWIFNHRTTRESPQVTIKWPFSLWANSNRTFCFPLNNWNQSQWVGHRYPDSVFLVILVIQGHFSGAAG